MVKNITKTKQSTKLHICGIRGLTVNRHVKNPPPVSKEGPFVMS